MISVSYSLWSENTNNLCDQIFFSLDWRDWMQDQINENLKLTNQDLGNIESKIMKIKENLIACVIMNVIRNLNEKDKRSLR